MKLASFPLEAHAHIHANSNHHLTQPTHLDFRRGGAKGLLHHVECGGVRQLQLQTVQQLVHELLRVVLLLGGKLQVQVLPHGLEQRLRVEAHRLAPPQVQQSALELPEHRLSRTKEVIQ